MTGHIFIDGEIGLHTKPESVRSQISPQFSDYEIHINSQGGDVYDGYQIGNMILNIGKPTNAIVEGMCASIATYIACCADKVSMIPQGSWTIHDPTAQTGGRAEDLIQAAAQLSKIKDDIIARYMSKVGKTGITPQQLSDAMAKETTYDAQEAKEWGFADDVREKLRAVAKIDLTKFKMETLTKQEQIGLFTKLGEKLDSLVSMFKPEAAPAKPQAKVAPNKKVKNSMELTLTDGTVLQCDAEDPNNLEGATVSTADGKPITDGTYETADGLEIDIVNGTITNAEQEPTNESDDEPTEDTDPKIKNDDDEPTDDMETYDELMSQMEELQKKLKKATPGAQPVTAAPANKNNPKFKAKVEPKDESKAQFEAKITALEKQLTELKAMTVGDKRPPAARPLPEQHEEEYGPEFTSFANTVTEFALGRGLINRTN